MLHQSIFEPGSATAISLPEVVGAFSYTLDIGVGRAAGHSVRTCWIGMNLGRQFCVPDEDLRDLYYVLLLANSGFGQLHVSTDVARGIAHVREHWDGAGKPDQLRGHSIPLTSRITLVAQLVHLTHAKYERDGGKGKREIEASIPLKRGASAADVAGPIVFLCSDLARHITGEILNVNGGSVLCG